MSQSQPSIIVVMGVSGVGKTTVAQGLTQRLGVPFTEGDDFHPKTNVEKMHVGIPLTDEDRLPWLQALHSWMQNTLAAGRSGVLTCSALKRSYRDILRGDLGSQVRFCHLVADPELIHQRLAERKGHFMPPSLLQSQLDTLEPLGDDELSWGSVKVSVAQTPEQTVEACLAALAEPTAADR